MGGGEWDTSVFATQQQTRRQTGQPTFDFDAAMKTRPANRWTVHEDLDPLKIRDSVNGVRESRDSDDHPTSRAVAAIFDVTGSMGSIPMRLQEKLGQLMTFLIMKGGLEHPQVLIGAVGDATCDRVPFQVGQFESDNRIDEQLRKVFLEGGGGGQRHESYELALYFAARKASMDCWEKRGEKAYLFLTGDEMPYESVKREEVARVFGDTLEADIPIQEIVEEVQEKFELFFLIASGGAHGQEAQIERIWKELLGERALRLDDPDAVCELIASQIAVMEGTGLDDALQGLRDVGASGSAVDAARKALVVSGGAQMPTRGMASGVIPSATRNSGNRRL